MLFCKTLVLLMIIQPPKGAFDHVLQLLGGAANGQVQVRRLMSNRYGLTTFEACFHQARLPSIRVPVSIA